MKITRNLLSAINLEDENIISMKEYKGLPGDQHYYLLAWLSTQFNGVEIFDIGTHMGASAAALSYNKNNTIQSFDIQHTHLAVRKDNCKYNLLNIFDPVIREEWAPRILASPFIFLDIDPGEGSMEYEFYCWLRDSNYRGILLLDDIWYFKGMRDNLWNKIETKKIDVSSLGHWSGTGLVDFSNSVEASVPEKDTSNWTLVTAYFDLTKEPDASQEIRNRDASYYLSHAKGTMGVEQNLVVFCDETTRPLVEKLRPAHLQSKTKYIVMNFTDFEIVKSRDKIIQNRKEKPYHFDNRNTASYYLFCMTRYLMVNMAIETNPFNSTHFGWINFCMERMGWKNLASLNESLSLNRDKFSTCWIDYRSKSFVQNYPEYFKAGYCGMCSGFFTGNAEYFKKFNDGILSAFHECLKAGYGHADEQLYLIVYYKNPEIFDWYAGDYTEMITNYCEVRERVKEPVHNLITNSFNSGDYAVCAEACNKLWNNREKLPSDYLGHYMKHLIKSCILSKRWDILDKMNISHMLF